MTVKLLYGQIKRQWMFQRLLICFSISFIYLLEQESDGGGDGDYNDATQSPAHSGCQALPAVLLHCPQEWVSAQANNTSQSQTPGMGMKIRRECFIVMNYEMNY